MSSVTKQAAFAVTGGTGSFAGVRGTVELTFGPQFTSYTIMLR